MRFTPPLAVGTLQRRYKRFLADINTAEGESLTVHCPNTGAMLGCDQPGSEIWYSHSENPARKYAHTLEVVVTGTGIAGINSARANGLVAEALQCDRAWLPELQGVELVRSEAAIPDARGRFDFQLRDGGRDCYLEVKSVTLCDADGTGRFPDAVSARGLKHIEALERRVGAGNRGILVFCAQHSGIERIRPADEIDPVYGAALRAAHRKGLEVYGCGCTLSPFEIRIDRSLTVLL